MRFSPLCLLAAIVLLVMVVPAAAAPYWGATYSDGRGAVCRTTGANSTDY